ncbi:lauroyl-Kdo(2)-lipid IV(A) myristoyltransferase, partial [Escherichia coli]|nr:lauroyl-Kdo(2)-lipid IV(A) myristoyltransferase [Escherichia coli]
VYNSKTHQLNIHILPPLNVPYDASNAIIARQINMVVENCVYNNIEQYTWILKLLKTRKPGENEPY